MATSAASAASSDANRAAYIRNSDPGNEGNRLRLDSSALSAFDLLLQLPLFDNQIPLAKFDAEAEPVDEQQNEDPAASDDEDSNANGLPTSPIPLPIANRFEEAVKRESKRIETVDRKGEGEATRETTEPAKRVTQEKPSVEVSNRSVSNQAAEVESEETIEPSQAVLGNQSNIVSLPPTEGEQVVASPEFDRGNIQESDQVSVKPIGTDVLSRGRNANELHNRESADHQTSDLPTEVSPIENVEGSKQPQKPAKKEVDSESVKRVQSTTPFVNRRADRLAESRRGEKPNDDSDKGDSETSEATESGSIEIPVELALDDRLIDPTLAVNTSLPLQTTELSDPSMKQQDVSTPTPDTSTSIISTGFIATASTTTSVVGLDGNKNATVNAIGGVQGAATFSDNAGTRNVAPLAGRGSSLSAYQEHRVLQRVLKGLDQLNDGGGQVRLRLHPPELGSLQVTLRVEAQQVSALIEVEHSAARDVLLSNLPQLQSRLADQGLNISQFDVQVVDPNQFSQGSGQGWQSSHGQGTGQNDAESHRSSQYLDRLRNQLDRPAPVDATRSVQSLWTRKNGELDVQY